MDDQPVCACRRVRYEPVEVTIEGGALSGADTPGQRDRWVCEACGAEFVPSRRVVTDPDNAGLQRSLRYHLQQFATDARLTGHERDEHNVDRLTAGMLLLFHEAGWRREVVDHAEVWRAEKRAEQNAEAAEQVALYVRQQRRDQFAAAALTGILARGRDATKHAVSNVDMAWKIADAMLEHEPTIAPPPTEAG